MNDDELGRRLQDELHRRINPPDCAPEAVHEHLRSLRSMQQIRFAGRSRRTRLFRDLFGLAAAAALAALVVAGILWRNSGQPATGAATPTATPSRSPFLWTPGPTAINITPRASTILRAERIDATTGWAEISRPDGSVHMVFTNDGGSTWSEPPQGEVANGSQGIEFLDKDHGWQVGEVWGTSPTDRSSNLTVSRTTDGGVSWRGATLSPGTSLDQNGGFENLTVHFRDHQNGVVLFAYGGMADYTQPAEASLAPDVCEAFSTSDGGATWSAPTAGLCLAGATFVSSTLGYAYLWVHAPDIYSLSNSPDFYVTTDGGQTWTRAQLPEGWRSPDSSPAIYFMEQRSDGTIRALCGCGPHAGQSSGATLGINLISSSDGGLTWTSLGTPQGLDDTHAWMVGAVTEDQWIGADFDGQTLVQTSDAGLSWQKVEPVGLPTGAEPRQWSIWDGGWAVITTEICGPESRGGRSCITDTSTLYSTSDGGQTWTPILAP
jgi:photosystem II stability/assembly factor-like uncharacterized protein